MHIQGYVKAPFQPELAYAVESRISLVDLPQQESRDVARWPKLRFHTPLIEPVSAGFANRQLLH